MQIVRNCKGLPLSIKVIGTSLSCRTYGLWQKLAKELSQGHSILDSNTELLTHLQKLFDVLEDNSSVIKECFMDLALFPEDQRTPATILIDMWAELYGLDDHDMDGMSIINKLDSMNLANVLIASVLEKEEIESDKSKQQGTCKEPKRRVKPKVYLLLQKGP
ncbi:hypothetical protein SESBI_12985 [Sesbania bispinosa]|nr:hypothetical protein SESBI_12985 [Sesbania bispinosa]